MPHKEDRYIKVFNQEGDEIFHGKDRRFYDMDYKKCFMGVSLETWLKLISLFTAGIIFWNTYVIKTEARLQALEKNTNELIYLNKDLQEYIHTLDIFLSSVYDTRFKNGSPVDINFKNKSYFKSKGD